MHRKTSPARYSPVPNIITLAPYSCIETMIKCPCNGLFPSRLVFSIETTRLVTKIFVVMVGLVNARLSLNVTSSEKSPTCGFVRLPSEPVLQTRKSPFERLMPEFGTSKPAMSIPVGWTKMGVKPEAGIGLLVKKLRSKGVSPSVLVDQARGSAASYFHKLVFSLMVSPKRKISLPLSSNE